jgi:hypothetical protein
MISSALKKNASPFKLLAFRANENKSLAKRCVRAHLKELQNIGVKNIASSDPDWINDPQVIVFCLISLKTNAPVAGMKLDIWNKNKSLPIIDSLCNQAFDMKKIVQDHSSENIAEFCGLWVTEEVSNAGISKIITRSAISVLPSLGIGKSIAFSSQYTIKTLCGLGFQIYSEIGDGGKFTYPTKDFESYVALLHDTESLTECDSHQKKLVRELRNNPMLIRLENEKGKNTLIQYDLRLVKKEKEVHSII